MALNTILGTLTQPAATGNQAITGLGFTPKVVIFFADNSNLTGSTVNDKFSFGVSISSTVRRAMAVFSTDAATTTLDAIGMSQLAIIAEANGAPIATADFVSMDAAGFTINWTLADAIARLYNYIAIGGSDLTNVNLLTPTRPTTLSSVGVTGMGFRPDCLLFFASASFASETTGAAGSSSGCIGFATDSTHRGYTGFRNTNAVTTTATARNEMTTKCIGFPSATGLFAEADLTSIDADGYTLNWTTVNATAGIYYVLGLKGAKFATGSALQPTSTGNQSITSPGFRPSAVLLASANNTASGAVIATQRLSIGAASGAVNRSIWGGDTNGVTTSVAKINQDQTKALSMITESATPTVNAAASLSTFDANGFTLNWATADVTAREYLWLAIGSFTWQPLTENLLPNHHLMKWEVLEY